MDANEKDHEMPPPYYPQYTETGTTQPGCAAAEALQPPYPSLPPPAYSVDKQWGPGVVPDQQTNAWTGYNQSGQPFVNAAPYGTAYGNQQLQHQATQQQQFVIIQQPGPGMWGAQAPLVDPPEDYMGYSIFVTLCCCWLVGIFAIQRSSECRAAIASGDRVTAEIKSREALQKAHMSLGLGILSFIVVGAILGVYYGIMFSRA